MSEEQSKRIEFLEDKFYLGLWDHEDGYEYAEILFGSYGNWATPESYQSY